MYLQKKVAVVALEAFGVCNDSVALDVELEGRRQGGDARRGPVRLSLCNQEWWRGSLHVPGHSLLMPISADPTVTVKVISSTTSLALK